MTADPLYCRAGDDAYLVLEMITTYGLRAMVVLNERGELEGVISIVALANKLAAASKALCAALERLYDQENTPEIASSADKADEFHAVMAEQPHIATAQNDHGAPWQSTLLHQEKSK